MSNHAHQFIRLALITMLTLPIAGAVGLIILHARGERLLSVQTASMVPTFRPGDAIIVQPVSPSSLRAGDIVSYRSPRDPGVVISHRLIEVNQPAGRLVTAGDALHTPDQPFLPLLVVGRATAVAPGLGTVLDAPPRPLGLVIMVYLPAALVIGAEALRLSRHYRRPAYLLDYRHGTKS
jgi:signal peptidase